MTEANPECPYCGVPAKLVHVPTRVKRGDRVLSVSLETWECVSGCRSEDGSEPFGFTCQALALRNDALVRERWREIFGTDLPEPRRPGRKPQEPRVRTVQVKLTESELHELDSRRGGLSRSEYLRAHALPPARRSA